MSGAPRGVLLKRTLDDRSPSRRFDARALAQEIAELEQAVAPLKLFTAVRRRGPLVDVAVIAGKTAGQPSRPASASGGLASVSAWSPSSW